MRAFSSRRLRQEDGIALVLALGITSVLIIFVASMIDYTTSNSRAARLSSSSLTAMQYADAGLNTAYSILVNQKVSDEHVVPDRRDGTAVQGGDRHLRSCRLDDSRTLWVPRIAA